MFTLTCRQRGCALAPAETLPEFCPVCANPLIPEDQIDGAVSDDVAGADNDAPSDGVAGDDAPTDD